MTSHGDPDPGRRNLHALQPIGGAVPDDVTVVRRQDTEAQWSSCDGREGTFGWTDVSVIINFKTTTQPDTLVSLVGRRMVAAGWTPGSTQTTSIGPVGRWTRTLEDGTKAGATLSPGTADNGQTITWDLAAYAPPHGPRASGC